MADTQPMAPTDAEIVALADATRTAEGGANGYILPISFARAVLAKWGSQPVGAQPAPQQEAQYNHGPQAETVAEAARDVGKWLNERPNRPIDLRHVAMLCAHAQAQAAPAAVAGPSDEALRIAVDHAHEILRRLMYHRDGEFFINVNRRGAEALHVSTVATIVQAALAAAPTTQTAPQQEAQEPYSIDIDPQGIRALVADAITGALAFGAQGTNAPPDGHWLAPFWAAARAEREAAPVADLHPKTSALVAAKEREACAQVAMEFRRGAGDPVCGEVATAIRERDSHVS